MTSGIFTCLLFALPTAYADPSNDQTVQTQQQVERININLADVEQLVLLKGVGKKKAQAIVEFRLKNGNFSSIEDLQNVKGIGDNVIKENINRVIF